MRDRKKIVQQWEKLKDCSDDDKGSNGVINANDDDRGGGTSNKIEKFPTDGICSV